MKSEKGVTLVSLVTYVVVLSVLIGVISSIMTFFYGNLDKTIIDTNTSNQYSRFVAYLTKDLNSRKSKC